MKYKLMVAFVIGSLGVNITSGMYTDKYPDLYYAPPASPFSPSGVQQSVYPTPSGAQQGVTVVPVEYVGEDRSRKKEFCPEKCWTACIPVGAICCVAVSFCVIFASILFTNIGDNTDNTTPVPSIDNW